MVTEEFLDTRAVGKRLGVTRARADQLSREYDDFPEPAITLPRRRIWRRADIDAWVEAHPDRGPGRPRKET